MLNRKKTRLDIIPASLKITGKTRTAFLTALLCAIFIPPPLHAQEYRQYSPGVEINTGVLNELSRQMDDDSRGSNRDPVKLKRPAPQHYNTDNNRQSPALTGRSVEQDSEEEYIIMPRSASQTQTVTPAKQKPDDDFMIIPQTKLEAKETQKQLAVKAPLPAKKPRSIIQTAKAERLKNIPLPQKRPAIQQASRSFIEAKRRDNARVTDKNAPNLIASAQKTMPAAPADPVVTEQLAGERINTHKNRIINAVQQIARANKEPDIDITAKSLKPRPNKPQAAHDITATSKKPQNIEPAAGWYNAPTNTPKSAPAKVAAYSTNNGEVVRIPFPSDESKIDNAIKAAINAHILPSLQSDPVRRIQLQSYASQKKSRSHLNARRVSLSRALSVRQYLVAMGIDAKRIDIMPLGDKTGENQEDRIDFLIFNPNAS